MVNVAVADVADVIAENGVSLKSSQDETFSLFSLGELVEVVNEALR